MVYEAAGKEPLGDEALARRLDISVRRLSGYKAGKGISFLRALDFLNRAGWIATVDEIPSAVHLAAAEEQAADLRRRAELFAQQARAGRERRASK